MDRDDFMCDSDDSDESLFDDNSDEIVDEGSCDDNDIDGDRLIADEDNVDDYQYASNHGQPASDGKALKFYTATDLISEQVKLIEHISSIFELKPGTARVLLEHFGWNKEQLMDRYLTQDHDTLFEEAHCIQPKNLKTVDGDICGICACDGVELIQLGCGHQFCRECWQYYIKEKVEEQGQQIIACPEFGCDIVADEFTVTTLLNGPEFSTTLVKFQERIADAIVLSKRNLRWCPAPDCKLAVEVPHSKFGTVTCTCGAQFCFQCGQENHTPLLCNMLRSWLKKCEDDSETAHYLDSKTKLCPKCQSVIEKAGGCNHMKCFKCRCEFCWICLGDWEPHGSSWYKCSRYSDDAAADARQRVDSSRKLLRRYLFYFDRYKSHESSRKFEEKLNKAAATWMTCMQTRGLTWFDVKFFLEGVKTLQHARRVLQYTYVFAFYLKPNAQRDIFEENLADLQQQTEKLSEFLERNVDLDAEIRELKSKILNLSTYCKQRILKLVEHVYEGYQQNFWKYDIDVAAVMGNDVDEFIHTLEIIET